MAHVSSSTGPGTQTPDGCSVNLYRLLPYMGELADIEPHLYLLANCGFQEFEWLGRQALWVAATRSDV